MTCQTAARSRADVSVRAPDQEDAMSVHRVIDVIGTSTQSWKTPRFLAAVHRAGDFRDACGFRRC